MRRPNIRNPRKTVDEEKKEVVVHVDIISEDTPEVVWYWKKKPIPAELFKTSLKMPRPGRWLGTLKCSNAKDICTGLFEIMARNNAGATTLHLNLKFKGFSNPEMSKKVRQTFDVDDHRVLTVGVQNLYDEFEEKWFINGQLIEKDDPLYERSQKKEGFDEYVFNLKIMNDQIFGLFKLVVSNECGELNCEYDIQDEPKAPYLSENVKVRALDTHVTIIVPFVSHSIDNEIRWTVDRQFTDEVCKNESYRQLLYRERWNQHEVKLQFNVKALQNRRYRCEIWNEAGKLEVFADVQVVDDCQKETREFYEIKHVAGVES